MKHFVFAAAAVFLLTGTALAETRNDRPTVVAEEGGVSVQLGDRNHNRDARRHRGPIVVVGRHDHDRHDHHDRHDRDHDRDH